MWYTASNANKKQRCNINIYSPASQFTRHLQRRLTLPSLNTKFRRPVGQLPGLSPVNVTVSLEEQKFTCTAVRKGAVYYERTCTRGLPSVNLIQILISGREPSIVDFIEISVLENDNPENKTAHEILGLIATMPYEGADSGRGKGLGRKHHPCCKGQTRRDSRGAIWQT